jgi:hypothetical protein
MQLLPLESLKGHLFVTPGEDNWLVDTGAQISYFQNRSLPDILGMTILLANTQDIIGNC